MGILRSAIKFNVAKKVTKPVLGNGVISTVASVKMVENSNDRVRRRRRRRRI